MWTSKFTLREDVASSNLGKLVTQSAQVTRCGFTFGIFWRTEFNEWMASAQKFSLQCNQEQPLDLPRLDISVRLLGLELLFFLRLSLRRFCLCLLQLQLPTLTR